MNPKLPQSPDARTQRVPNRWIEDVTSRGPTDVGQAFGLTFTERPAPGNLSPCPACSSEKRHPSRRDRRGAIGITRDGAGWRCHECDAHGDAVDLAAWLAVGRVPSKGELAWREIRAACAGHGLCPPDPRNGATPAPRVLRPVPSPKPPAPPARPAGVAEAWVACLPVTTDPDVAAWLVARGLDPRAVEIRDLARALPRAGQAPPWARFEGRSWRESTHRVIVPMYGPAGAVESVHARALAPREANGRDKAASPSGAEVRGLVLADARGVSMLRGEYRPASLVIAEGPPDFLTWATRWSDADDESAPAVLGVLAGSWSDEFAARVPSDLRVAVRTHRDGAGEKYAARIVASLAARCAVYRLTEPSP